MCDLRGLSKHEVNQHYFEFVRSATKEEYEERGLDKRASYEIYKCRKCDKLHYFRKDQFKRCLKICDNECNGMKYGKSGIVIYDYNDSATTNPELIKYFPNPEDAKKYTAHSRQKVPLKCPECGKEKWMMLDTLSRQGFSCDQCSDGISYPEKIMSLILSELNIKYQKQFKFDGFNYMYDFYLPEYNYIIEVHGKQHYNYSGFARTYEDEHENDMCKYDLAVLNGYEYNKNFFIIDARESNIEYLKSSIEQCKIFKQFELTIIDWGKMDKNAQKSLKIDICKYWNEHENLTLKDLGKVFGIRKTTITDYLNWGNKNGLCVYDGKEEKIKNYNQRSIFVFLIKENGEKWFDEPLSLMGLSRRTEINNSALGKSLHKKRPLSGHAAKFDAKYIGSIVVLAEETEWKGKTEEEMEEYSRKQSDHANNKGKNHPMYGKHHSEETKQKISEAKKGKNNPSAKRVAQYDKKGNLIKIWDYAKKASEELGIHNQSISACCKGKYKSAGGFIWRYAEQTE